MRRYCLTVDLKNDDKLIAEYEAYHRDVWPAILKSIGEAGIIKMQIYRWASRLFMIMEVDETFSFENKKKIDLENPVVQQWESLMSNFQQALPGTKPGDKWLLMNEIFSFNKSDL